jgi:histidinol-phosphate aminotransferase
MKKINIDNLVRANIKALTPYSSARDEFKGEARIFLDANENSYGSPLKHNYHRYPDPLQNELKEKIADLKGIPAENIFLGNGSDEAIDLLIRAFCNPGIDNILITPPTYGMYEVSANINDVGVKKSTLYDAFDILPKEIIESTDSNTKIIFLCSPNNPTGNCFSKSRIIEVLTNFNGIVVIDEAYIDFSAQKSFIYELNNFENVVVLQTFSKAWGLAGLRLGVAYASKEIISILNRIKPPYNINSLSQQLVLDAINNYSLVQSRITEIIEEREKLSKKLMQFSFVKKIYPSDANFILAKTENAQKIYDYLCANGIIVRDRSKVIKCNNCLRITVGTKEENKGLIDVLKKIN